MVTDGRALDRVGAKRFYRGTQIIPHRTCHHECCSIGVSTKAELMP